MQFYAKSLWIYIRNIFSLVVSKSAPTLIVHPDDSGMGGPPEDLTRTENNLQATENSQYAEMDRDSLQDCNENCNNTGNTEINPSRKIKQNFQPAESDLAQSENNKWKERGIRCGDVGLKLNANLSEFAGFVYSSNCYHYT